jgi:AAA+ ATPase superfamily predicted ATPase
MTKDKPEFKKEVAFINREKELTYLRDYINIRPESILFLHGPKSSGKTTLLYKFFDQIPKEQKLDVKFLNLIKTLTEFSDDYNYKDFLSMFFDVDEKGEKKGKLSAAINVGFFKIDSEIEKKMKKGKVDPFKVMEREFLQLNGERIFTTKRKKNKTNFNYR